MRKSLLVAISFVIALVFVPTVLAHHRQEVLGDATTASELVFPPVTAGPGIILPDSPFYFADEWFQKVRLALVFSIEDKAKLRSQIAGERLAELRVMFSRNNTNGIEKALSQLTKETTSSAENLTEAAAEGKNVKKLAKEVNDTIKSQRELLGALASQSRGTLRLRLHVAREALKESKLEIEDQLPEQEFENEIEEDIQNEIEDTVESASDSARGLEHAIDVLTRLASQAAERQQSRRLEALQLAIENKNETLRRREEKLLVEEKKKEQKLLQVKEKAIREAREAVRQAQEAAKKFREVHKATQELRNQPVNETTVNNEQSTVTSESGENKDLSEKSGSAKSSDED